VVMCRLSRASGTKYRLQQNLLSTKMRTVTEAFVGSQSMCGHVVRRV
jgi:hypothetical protein